ncbi:MAG TPA: hypothetical protein VLI05_01305 [Candidatus Saccharimonadia bacterium]|nr:hypothetical protein [Candidatus Saccharimonadia bacterium]
MASTSLRVIPFSRFAVVASAGLVAFLAFWQGFFSLIHYRPCAIIAPNYALNPNPGAGLTEFGIAATATLVLFYGAKRLRTNFDGAAAGYIMVVTSLLVGQGVLAFIFLQLSTCAG